MARIQTLFATAAVMALLVGLLAPNLGSGLSITRRGAAYLVPNSMLCYGIALFFCFFAILYSVWTVPWSAQATRWHFILSILLVGVFGAASYAGVRFNVFQASSEFAMPILIAFTFSPILFLIVQGFFLLDGIRRAWPVLTA